MYVSGEGVAEDDREAVRWLRKAAEQGDADAQYFLGLMYANGKGVAKDDREVVRWYRKAAEQGNASAQYNLGVMYYNGKGIPKDDREAVRWYRKAAEQGNTGAQNNLGVMYANGEGVAEDDREAVRWLRKAAEQGDAKAQYSLGLMYANGKGVAEDDHEALRWYRKAAEQGNASAQNNLGVMYDNGEGVAEDDREAVRWYLKAAEQGLADAQYNLGLMYAKGEGVITDFREAYIWFSIAKANGIKNASDTLRELDWGLFLSQAEARSARKEAARRFEAIENREQKPDERASINTNIALVDAPKEASTAARVFENAWRSVVVVLNGENQGSGVIIRPNIVATNCHVVDSASRIIVHKSENRRANTEVSFAAEIRHEDSKRDFCLLDVKGLWGVPATVRRYDTLKIGEPVYGLGAPSGLDLSLSDGIVSQLREVDGHRFIQTNAAISPGSSGGGLFDSEGNLVGIMTWKIADESVEGIGFAIPADLTLQLR